MSDNNKINTKDRSQSDSDNSDDFERFEYTCAKDASRLDTWLRKRMDGMSRTYIKKLITKDKVIVNGDNAKKAGMPVKKGDVVVVIKEKPKPLKAKPQNIDINILYDDEDIIIVDKPRGMVVHPAPGNRDKTLVNALMYKYKNKLSDINGVLRPGIVHRIDKNTSGILVVARNNKAHNKLAALFKTHDIKREYQGICKGVVSVNKGVIKTSIGRHHSDRKKMAVVKGRGKKAVTHFSVIKRYDKYTLFKAVLETGRTHQIRVHMAYIGHPLAADDKYGKNEDFKIEPGQILHAKTLGFKHPGTGKYVEFNSDLPEYFKKVIQSVS